MDNTTVNLLKPTNTFSNDTLNILKNSGLQEPLINMNSLKSNSECFLSEAISFVKKQDDLITANKMNLYKAISESDGNPTVILESFSDFFVKVKDVIDKFLSFIKSLFDRCIDAIMAIIKSDKYIIKHKKKFDSFKSSDEFEFDGFRYTIPYNVPEPHAIAVFNEKLFNEFIELNITDLTINNIQQAIDAIDSDKVYDEFRAQVIGKHNDVIYSTDFGEELFMIFRDGDLNTSEFTVTSSEVRNSLRRFLNYEKDKSEIRKLNTRIEKEYNEVKKQLEEICKNNGSLNYDAFIKRLPSNTNIIKIDGSNAVSNTGTTMSAEIMSKMDIFTKAKVDQITEMSNIHALAFTAKLDALKECYVQDRNILYRALLKIDRTDSVRK